MLNSIIVVQLYSVFVNIEKVYENFCHKNEGINDYWLMNGVMYYFEYSLTAAFSRDIKMNLIF